MKNLLLPFLLLIGYCANAAHVQINFVAGFNIAVTSTYQGSPSEGTATTDSGINTIFLKHGVSHCVNTFSNPAIIFADYQGANISSFINDLLANANVLKAKICFDDGINGFTYADRMSVKLFDNTNGNPTDISGTVITTNTQLNTIFATYKVTSMSQVLPSSLWYTIYFDGDITALRTELENLNSVVDITETVGVIMLLDNPKYNYPKTLIYPNPFSNNFNITTERNITTYSIIDVTGKTIISSVSKSEIDDQTTKLNTGVYFLNLQFKDGQRTNYKLIKE